MIPKRHRAELPAGHPMVIDEDDETGRPIVILADWVPEDRETEQQLVREAMRWWKTAKRSGLAMVPLALATSAAWAGEQLKNPIVSATTATAVTAAVLVAFVPGDGHHATNGVRRPPVAAPPATPVQPQPQPRPPKAVPVSQHKPKQGPAPSTTKAHSQKAHKMPKPRKSRGGVVTVEPVVGKVPPVATPPTTPVAPPVSAPAPWPTNCSAKGLLGAKVAIGKLCVAL